METFFDLYKFIELAKNSRKYSESTANNLKSSLKLFEKFLTEEELYSVDMIEDRIKEIFMGLIDNNRDKSIESLNTYKSRFLRVIKDFKRYGDPVKMQSWLAKPKKSTPPVIKKDNQDKTKDKNLSALSDPSHTPVHKIELSLRDGEKISLFMPLNATAKDIKTLKAILDSLISRD